jgi:hypothetical protein
LFFFLGIFGHLWIPPSPSLSKERTVAVSAISADFARQSGDTRPGPRQVVGLPAARNLARHVSAQEPGASTDTWHGGRLRDTVGTLWPAETTTTVEDKQGS